MLVQKDADSQVHVVETGDHLGRKDAKIGGGVGLVVGLFAPPLLAATVAGAAVGAVLASSPNTGSRAESPKRWTRPCRPAREA